MGGSSLPRDTCVTEDVQLGERVRLSPFVNLYGGKVGADTRIGLFFQVQRGATIGQRRKISSHTFVCSGIGIEDAVFVGHGVVFINDRFPRASNPDGAPQQEGDWRIEATVVRRCASIGSGTIVMCGVEIGEGAMVGAGALVARNLPAHGASGAPGRLLHSRTGG